ncbi:TRAPP I complex [Ceraceosorus guamensis]|uniref:Trafficking protein particle complex subunit BET3 n=1 Tax=Ceraceosorus guamensis TaxID=1522189 RepID=A0A316WBP7_9BASI|nr:TRAPP I complex [Ceraceosorus guamensis]PWN45343.1 TRAPP I complex [Ceraceosorus guamensis]
MSSKALKALGEDVWKNRAEKVNAELFTLTYGALVVQLIKDYEDYTAVNAQLDKMGYNIGTRLIEDFLARTGLPKCRDFAETAEVLSKVGFRLFLNITPVLLPIKEVPLTSASQSAVVASAAASASGQTTQEFGLVLEENPLAEFVELDEEARLGGLWWSNVLCGVIRGALEMVQLQTEVRFVSDVLKGDETTEMRVKLIRVLDEEAPIADD